jgi:hypothetical protein
VISRFRKTLNLSSGVFAPSKVVQLIPLSSISQPLPPTRLPRAYTVGPSSREACNATFARSTKREPSTITERANPVRQIKKPCNDFLIAQRFHETFGISFGYIFSGMAIPNTLLQN